MALNLEKQLRFVSILCASTHDLLLTLCSTVHTTMTRYGFARGLATESECSSLSRSILPFT